MSAINHLLESLAPADRARIEPDLTRIDLRRDEVIVDVGRDLAHAYLPLSAILSVITVMSDGRMIESRTIGRESGYGLLHALGSRHSYERVEVQVAGEAWRLPLDALAPLAQGSRGAMRALVAHAQATLIQSAVAVACNTLHAVEPRLCRWLLLTQDRLGSDVLPLTQEHLAIMLGVQRTTVTAAMGVLQDRKAVSTHRGRIQVLDRASLEACACECYEAIEAGVERLLAAAPGA